MNRTEDERMSTQEQSPHGSCGCHTGKEEQSGQCRQTISQHLQQAAEMYRKAEKEFESNKEKAASYEHQGLGHVMIAMKCIKKSLIMCAEQSSEESSSSSSESTQSHPESQITA